MAIILEKRAEKIRINLEKKQIKSIPPIRVGVALDVTGSIKHLYAKSSGVMQETVARLLALAMRFDDNGSMDMWSFEDRFYRLNEANKENHENYVQAEIVDNRSVPKWGSTYYAPVLEDMTKFYFSGESAKPSGVLGFFGLGKRAPTPGSDLPAYGMMVTDGDNADKAATERILREAAKHNIYWQMVGVGSPSQFGFLEKMARELPNVGFINLSDLNISDDELYDQLLSDELVTWLKKL